MAQQAEGHQEGSRWINKRPTGKEVADWFIANAPMHPGMDPARYVTGVVLIPAKEDGRQVFVPYIKVETRVAYFWDYVSTLAGAVGVIESADVPRIDETGHGFYNMNLPPGFFRMPVQDQAGKLVHFIGCSQQVRIYREVNDTADTVMRPTTGTKVVPLLTKWGVDENAIMKAETGAVGRALGMAGMLVIPGSGVATAEDMQEMLAAEGRPSVGVEPQLPNQASADDQVRERIAELSAQLESEHPGRFEEVMAWAREKKIDTDDLKAHQLRGVLRALERAEQAATT